jgi:glycine/D-amino acid oxidase-like deaminating enzyme
MLQNLSYWEKTTYLDQIDFAIIGSGIVGINAAICLKERFADARIMVLERGVFPLGASTKNAGFACFGSVSELMEDMEIMGIEAVLDLVEKRWGGLQRLKERCGVQQIDFEQFGGYELYLDKDKNFKESKAFIPFVNEKLAGILGEKRAFSLEKNRNKFGFGSIQGLIFNQLEGQINPAKMMAQLRFKAASMGIQILSGVEVTKVEEQKEGVQLTIAEKFSLFANKTLIATNGFAKQLMPELAVQPARNQVLITKPIPNLAIKGTFHYDKGYYYFRNVGNRILLGGARNSAKEEETTTQFGLTPLIQNKLNSFINDIILPNQKVEIEHRWSGILGVGEEKAPIIKKCGEHIAIAVRLGGMGVAIGSLVGEEGAAILA